MYNVIIEFIVIVLFIIILIGDVKRMIEISNFHVTNIIVSLLVILLIMFLLYFLIYKLIKRLIHVGLNSSNKVKDLENRVRQLEDKTNNIPE